MNLFIAPHNDDEALFGAFTLMREKPLVLLVTDSWIQFNRGDNITWLERRNETIQAMKLLGCPVVFGALRDDQLTEQQLRELFDCFQGFNKVYAPAKQGGNAQHDLISDMAAGVFPNVTEYTTYTPTELYTTGKTEIIPTEQELGLKQQALQCYKSQLSSGATRPHFTAVLGKSEWYA